MVFLFNFLDNPIPFLSKEIEGSIWNVKTLRPRGKLNSYTYKYNGNLIARLFRYKNFKGVPYLHKMASDKNLQCKWNL